MPLLVSPRDEGMADWLQRSVGQHLCELGDLLCPRSRRQLMQRQQQRGNGVVITVQVRKRDLQSLRNGLCREHGGLVHTQFVPTYPRPTARLINSDEHSHLFLRPSQRFSTRSQASAEDSDGTHLTRHVSSLVTGRIIVVTFAVTCAVHGVLITAETRQLPMWGKRMAAQCLTVRRLQ